MTPSVLTNPRAERVKAVRALGRRSVRQRSGRFVVDGPQGVREVLRFAPHTVLDLYVDGAALDRHETLVQLARDANIHVHQCDPAVMTALVDTQHPQGIVAVCRPVDVPVADALGDDTGFVVVLAHVRDPGNAGTVIRSADAAGARAVILSDASVDLYNPKVVRSTAGSLWHLPIALGGDVAELVAACRERGRRVLAADGAGSTLLPDADLSGGHAWLMGNEAWGLDETTRALADDVVRVPIHGHAESLNLALAATVCMYASAEHNAQGPAS
ncbi:RNA methyltransferase [Flexivirga endophytica]|uniref:RNA methyltransferase n=1 Tax=Flexivirga endophytica TaxID=1849103 RepID=A0A916WYH2_9MICO|nr:RNA methyltransferase [Flexivirga endophytica]GGB42299.1 RNA methyltransferase [Flexivirga endophytica]GHB70488.1 RNA methyltransferase [Flexivirga endophytica]